MFFAVVRVFSVVFLAGFVVRAAADGIAVGNSRLVPSLSVEWFDSSNVFPAEPQHTDSTGFLVSPNVSLEGGTGDTEFALGYEGNYAEFDDAEEADYDDHRFYANGDVIFSSRSRLSLSGFVHDSHVLYGEPLSDELLSDDEPITYQQAGIEIAHTYGAAQARGNLRTEVVWDSRDYDNYPALTDGLSYSSVTPAVTLLYSVSSDTRALVGVSYQMLDYDGDSTADSGTSSVFTGAEWDATGKTGGSAKVGVGSRNFDSDSRDDETTMTIAATAYWLPLSYSRLDLSLYRNFAVDTVSTTVATVAALNWRHDWTPRLRSFTTLKRADYSSDDESDERTLDTARLRLGVGLTRWLSLTGEVAKEWSDSPNELLDFERDWLAFGVELEL
ncbi:outer membrane beta-barrel protein [Granulosicoccaceae sp. 1_MG-2023]|nr:outer membrane beta-barrel protein [Granulosicoccaceae sp. 1_MG-2023]